MSDFPRAIILSIVTGDALGTPLDGMSRGHIKSSFGALSGYADPEPALRGRMERWKKPGLYSSISQFMLLLGITSARRGPCIDAFTRFLASSPALAESGYGIFRYADAAERGYIAGCRDGAQGAMPAGPPSTRIIACLAPLAFRDNSEPEMLDETIRYLLLFTSDRKTLAAGLAYAFLLRRLSGCGPAGTDPVNTAIDCAAGLEKMIASDCSARIFGTGVNPDALAGEVRALAGILTLVRSAGSPGDAEEMICSHTSRTLPTPITRATVNMPLALLPYAVFFSTFHRDDADLLYRAAAEGGSSSSFTAIVGGLAATGSGAAAMPDELLPGLVNRKKIVSIADVLAAGSADPALADDFIRSEASLSAKAEEELRARVKHLKKKPERKSPSRADRERSLSRHVVESWTKLDKAKWKKERKQRAPEEES